MNTQRQEQVTELSLCCTFPIEFSLKVVPILGEGNRGQGSQEVNAGSVFRRQKIVIVSQLTQRPNCGDVMIWVCTYRHIHTNSLLRIENWTLRMTVCYHKERLSGL
jgi:hypothetical protein